MTVATPDDPYPDDAPNNPATTPTTTNPTPTSTSNNTGGRPTVPRNPTGADNNPARRGDVNPEWQEGWGPLGPPQQEGESFGEFFQRRAIAGAHMKESGSFPSQRQGGIQWGNMQSGNRPGGFSTNPFRNRPGGLSTSQGV